MEDGDTFSDYHTYEIDWKPDQLTWSIDGDVKRTLKKSDTFNKTDNQYHYPQTPARVQLSLWPAGISKNGKGTVEWAGGLINWGAQDVKNNGYYYSMFKSVEIECYDAPDDIAYKKGGKSYIFADRKGVEKSIAITGNDTVLTSLLGTGTDMEKDYPKKSTTKTGKNDDNAKETEAATIPGLTGAGPGTDGSRGGGGNSGTNTGSDSGSGSGGGSGTDSGSDASSTGIGGFSQGTSDTSTATKVEHVVAGSTFAMLMAFVGMLVL